MRQLLAVLLSCLVAFGQYTPSPSFPTAVPSDADLPIAFPDGATTLSTGINNSTLTIPVANGALFPLTGTQATLVRIDNETIKICSRSGNTLTACADGRGYASTSAATHASGAAVRGTVSSYMWNRMREEIQAIGGNTVNAINVLKYGATGDGVTDDTAEIQAAINAAQATDVGGTVYLPCGQYRVSSTLNINEDQITFMGAGYCTEIMYTGSGSAVKLNGGSSAFGAVNVGEKNIVRNLFIWSTSPSGVTGVEVEAQNTSTVYDVFVQYVETGFQFTNNFRSYIVNSHVSNWGVGGNGSALVNDGSNDMMVLDCFFGSGQNGHSGIRIRSTGGMEVRGTGILFHAGAAVLADPGGDYSSVSQVVATNGTAVATTTAPHPFTIGQSVTLINGALASNVLNATHTVTAVTSTTFTFAVNQSTVPNGTYSGTLYAFTSRRVVANLFFWNTEADVGAGIGFKAAPTGVGYVSNVHWVGSWTDSTDQEGVKLEATLPAYVEDVFFDSHRSQNNVLDGFNLQGNGVSKVFISDSSIAGNSRDAVVKVASSISVTSNVATATTTTNHTFGAGHTVVITGGTAALSGTYTILDAPTPTTFTFAKTIADGTYAGDYSVAVSGGYYDAVRIGSGVSKVSVTNSYIGDITWLRDYVGVARQHAVGIEFESGVGGGHIIKGNLIESARVAPIYGMRRLPTGTADYCVIEGNIPVDQNSSALTAASTVQLSEAPYRYYTISGATAIDNFTPALEGWWIQLRATGAGVNTTTAGNIQVAVTFTQDRLYTLVFRSGKWQISN